LRIIDGHRILFALLLDFFDQFAQLAVDIIVIVTLVGHQTVGAVFVAVDYFEISAALFAQCVQRAIAEQTVEVVGVGRLVTWEKLTVTVADECIVLGLGCFDGHGFTSVF
jgi:hypothetical protein